MPRVFAQSMGFSPQDFSDLDEADRKAATAAPPVKFWRQLPTRGLSGATGATRCMGGATCGSGAT